MRVRISVSIFPFFFSNILSFLNHNLVMLSHSADRVIVMLNMHDNALYAWLLLHSKNTLKGLFLLFQLNRKEVKVREKICEQLAIYSQLSQTIDCISKLDTTEGLLTQVNLGSNFYAQAKMWVIFYICWYLFIAKAWQYLRTKYWSTSILDNPWNLC